MRQNLSNIRIRGTVFHYPRRVPPKLVPIMGQTEVIRCLETSSAREARHRASAMNVETDRAFRAELSARYVGQVERVQTVASILVLEQLARALGVEPAELIRPD